MSVAWYDGAIRTVDVVSHTAIWHHAVKPLTFAGSSFETLYTGSTPKALWYVKSEPTFVDVIALVR